MCVYICMCACVYMEHRASHSPSHHHHRYHPPFMLKMLFWTWAYLAPPWRQKCRRNATTQITGRRPLASYILCKWAAENISWQSREQRKAFRGRRQSDSKHLSGNKDNIHSIEGPENSDGREVDENSGNTSTGQKKKWTGKKNAPRRSTQKWLVLRFDRFSSSPHKQNITIDKSASLAQAMFVIMLLKLGIRR